MILVGIVLLMFLAGAAWLLRPVPAVDLPQLRPHPARTYREALDRLGELQRIEAGQRLNDQCGLRLLAHAQRTEHVVLLLHGYANCPEQLSRLAERFYAQGFNVLAPRMPHHGHADRLGDQLASLSAEELVEHASTALDIACGLGRRVTVFGFSAGGALGLWLAQNRPEVETIVTLSAFLGVGLLPDWLNRPFTNAFLRLPNFFLWWDPHGKANSPYSMEYASPRFSLRNLAQLLRIAGMLERQARRQPPHARRAVFLVNQADPGVSAARQLALARAWQARLLDQAHLLDQAPHPTARHTGALRVLVDCFTASDQPLHDVVTPGMPGAPLEQVYERILRQVLAAHRHIDQAAARRAAEPPA
ncbi:MAG: alpha/beta hydrolase [Chloroflexota bacterium]